MSLSSTENSANEFNPKMFEDSSEPVKCAYNPANYLMALRKKDHNKSLDEFLSNFSQGFFESFITKGIYPLLANLGYVTNIEKKVIQKNLIDWLWGYYWKMHNKSTCKDVSIPEPPHNGNEDDFDWFRFCLLEQDLDSFFQYWAHDYFFDTSDAGEEQKLNFINFLWYHIDIYGSKRHMQWLDKQPYYESDEETWQDSEAYWSGQRKHKGDLY